MEASTAEAGSSDADSEVCNDEQGLGGEMSDHAGYSFPSYVQIVTLKHPAWFARVVGCAPDPKHGIQPFEPLLDQFWFLRKVQK